MQTLLEHGVAHDVFWVPPPHRPPRDGAVRRPGSAEAKQAIHADVDQTMFIGMLGSYYVINGKSFPDTEPITVTHGQTVRLRLIGSDVNMIHPMHLHGHYFTIVAEGGHPLASPTEKATIEVAPGDTYDVTFYAWAPPGSIYAFHCHILSHLMNPGQTGSDTSFGSVIVDWRRVTPDRLSACAGLSTTFWANSVSDPQDGALGLEHEVVRDRALLVRRFPRPATTHRRQTWVVPEVFEDMRAPSMREGHAQVIIRDLCRLDARPDQRSVEGRPALIAAR